jgi:hypothetical protein
MTRLELVLDSTEDVLARIDALSPADRAEASPAWLEQMRNSAPSAWTRVHRERVRDDYGRGIVRLQGPTRRRRRRRDLPNDKEATQGALPGLHKKSVRTPVQATVTFVIVDGDLGLSTGR